MGKRDCSKDQLPLISYRIIILLSLHLRILLYITENKKKRIMKSINYIIISCSSWSVGLVGFMFMSSEDETISHDCTDQLHVFGQQLFVIRREYFNSNRVP